VLSHFPRCVLSGFVLLFCHGDDFGTAAVVECVSRQLTAVLRADVLGVDFSDRCVVLHHTTSRHA